MDTFSVILAFVLPLFVAFVMIPFAILGVLSIFNIHITFLQALAVTIVLEVIIRIFK